MVSRQGSPPNSSSGMVHQFLVSDSRTGQPKFTNQTVSGYSPDSQMNAYPRGHGVLPSIQTLGERISTSFNLVPGAEFGHDRQLLQSIDNRRAQGLSLSLGSHLRHVSNELVVEARAGVDQIPFAHTLPTAYVVGNSKYLKPIQCLLQEVVNVNDKSLDVSIGKLVGKLLGDIDRQRGGASSDLKSEFYGRGILSPEGNDLHVKMAKLLGLLEELEKRYEKYYQQMKAMVSKFEEVAGEGIALLYTKQALQAVTRHFCCLSDAIVSQVNAAKRKLKLEGSKTIEKENRVLLEQIGFVQGQRNAWRPIRGLPETSVAILRAWLFEHFLHPYPNDPEKLMLASQTGLTKNQVSNWFINARVRLWKPMIEEMYREEVAGSPEESNSDLVETGKDSNRLDET